jgi:hypothetical protein
MAAVREAASSAAAISWVGKGNSLPGRALLLKWDKTALAKLGLTRSANQALQSDGLTYV